MSCDDRLKFYRYIDIFSRQFIGKTPQESWEFKTSQSIEDPTCRQKWNVSSSNQESLNLGTEEQDSKSRLGQDFGTHRRDDS